MVGVGTELGTLEGSFDISNDGNLEVLFLVVSLGYTDGKVIGSDEGIKLELSYIKFIGTILVNVVGITLGIDGRTDLVSSGVSFDDFNDGKLEGLLLGVSLVSTDCKVIGSDEVVKLVSTDGKVLRTILGNVDRITLDIDVGTELGSLDGSFDSSDGGNLEVFLLVGSLGYTDGKFFGSDEGIKLELSGGKVLGNILVNVDGIALGE